MGTAQPRRARVLLHSFVLSAAVLLAASCRPPSPQPGDDRALPAWERELRAKLSKPVTVEFREASLAQACETLSKLANVSIRIDPAVAAQGTPIRLAECAMPAESVLRWICRFARARYLLKDGAVVVAPLPSAGKLESQTYDLPSLIAHEPVPEERPREEPLCSGWCRYVRAAIAPDTWREDLGGNCAGERQGMAACAGRRLIVVHTEAVQAEVAKFLDAHRKMKKNIQVHILARFLMIDRGEVEAPKLQFQPERGGAASYALLREGQTEALLKAIIHKQRGAILSAPRLACYNTQRANFQALTNRGYVPRITPEEPPEIGNEPEGLLLDTQPFVGPDQRQITVILEGELRLPRATTALLRPDAVVSLPDGGSVFLILSPATTGSQTFKDKRLVAILLSAEVVPDIFEE
ncbi:MAG: hypothetical protein FJ291_24925 [Planctomycetes bacterium]|nr:hypothetical protein [Planctomycetota bacterium]